MAKINEKVTIQFLRGKDEQNHPEVRLFRNNDGKQGKAIYKFYKPTSITLENFSAIQKMYLIDEEGELSTRKINLSISEKFIKEVTSIYSWNSVEEFERYIRFAERYNSFIISTNKI